MLLSSQGAAAGGRGGGGGGGRALSQSLSRKCVALNFTHKTPPLFPSNPSIPKRSPLRLTLATPHDSTSSAPAKPQPLSSPPPPPPSSASASNSNNSGSGPVFVGQEDVPLEGVIQFEKPSTPSSFLDKWGRVGLLAGGDVLALLLFSTVGRFSHGFSVFDFETLRTADPFIAGWFLGAYFLGGYGEDGRGMNGRSKAIIAAAKSWALGIPLGLAIRAATSGHIPPYNFILVTMGSTAVLLVGWRTLLSSILSNDQSKKDDVYRRGSPFELFEVLNIPCSLGVMKLKML
ncbi:hypothetical protein Tsubulata_013710 [Turnera subulata]|uniref:Uncharacterized protein n=1 Tax=Turnera subulata TaxID=218843 RepID=A0A9Q0G8L8_9ROSI|nr:hypothetical protein Tsubulata_013710 [Turnera subulata]